MALRPTRLVWIRVAIHNTTKTLLWFYDNFLNLNSNFKFKLRKVFFSWSPLKANYEPYESFNKYAYSQYSVIGSIVLLQNLVVFIVAAVVVSFKVSVVEFKVVSFSLEKFFPYNNFSEQQFVFQLLAHDFHGRLKLKESNK